MSLKTVNLNLLPVLRELLRCRSVSVAAQAIGRSPSAVSEGLAQLRVTFADPLLVRAQGGMVLTPRALALVEPVDALWRHIEGVFADDSFDPQSAKRQFVIAAHDFHVFSLGPALLALFRDAAPEFELRFVDLGRDLSVQLAARDVDFALMPDFHLGELASAKLRHFVLCEDETVVLMRRGHALEKASVITHAQLAGQEQVAFHPTWESDVYRRAAMAFRRDLPVRARVAQIMMLPFMLAGTDFVALAPQVLAERVEAALNLTHRPLAEPQPPVRSVMAWSPVLDSEPAHRWFRERVRAVLATI